MTDAQTEARAIARKLQDVIEGHSWRLNIDKATDIIATALAAKDAELAQVIKTGFERCADISDRAERAEAQLAEARKALDEAIKAAGEQAILRGEAEGKLAASEMAGIVDGWKRRAEAAEARLAEALKALGMMLKEHDILSGNFGDVMDPKHKRPDRWPTAAEAARRVLEGGKSDE